MDGCEHADDLVIQVLLQLLPLLEPIQPLDFLDGSVEHLLVSLALLYNMIPYCREHCSRLDVRRLLRARWEILVTWILRECLFLGWSVRNIGSLGGDESKMSPRKH
jgi:hypothetical protein